MNRFDRNISFFGAEGQERLRAHHVAIVGCGGLGEHVIQQLAYLGIGALTLIDDEELSETNRNRYIFARHDDPVPGTHKVNLAVRAVREIDPSIKTFPVRASLRSEVAFQSLREANTIFGCVDNDGARLILTEFTSAYEKDYYDLATDTDDAGMLRFGGRVVFSGKESGCPVCFDALGLTAARDDLASDKTRLDRANIYGVAEELLENVGPSVVSLNGIVASLGVTEFMVGITGIRSPKNFISYHGNRGIVTLAQQEKVKDCYYCSAIRGSHEKSGVERYLTEQG